VLDDMHRHDGAERSVRDRREAFRDAGERDVEPTRAQIGHGALVRVEPARFDTRFAQRRKQLAAAATDVDDGRLRNPHVRLDGAAHFMFGAA